jgi:hypothetical protein
MQCVRPGQDDVQPNSRTITACYLRCDFLRDDLAVLDARAAARFVALFAPLLRPAILRVFFEVFVAGLLAADRLRADDLPVDDWDLVDLDLDLDAVDLRADDRPAFAEFLPLPRAGVEVRLAETFGFARGPASPVAEAAPCPPQWSGMVETSVAKSGPSSSGIVSSASMSMDSVVASAITNAASVAV